MWPSGPAASLAWRVQRLTLFCKLRPLLGLPARGAATRAPAPVYEARVAGRAALALARDASESLEPLGPKCVAIHVTTPRSRRVLSCTKVLGTQWENCQ